jgi:aspartokinase/homoserine dehydrogenase 1
VEAQHIIKTDASFGEANVLSELTQTQIKQLLNTNEEIPIITGFIGSTGEGTITTLGRSGSDYTASLIAGALCANLLEIWTDVDGVLTADPKIVPAAKSIEALSYDDIAELSAHGARVIHPKTIDPLRNCGIPVQVRNSLNPAHPGTIIKETFSTNGSFRSVTVTGPFTLVEIPGLYHTRFYGWLEKHIRSAIKEVAHFRAYGAEPVQYIIPEPIFQSLETELQQWLSNNSIHAEIKNTLYQVKKFSNVLLQNDEAAGVILQALAREDIQPVQWHRGHNRRHFSLLLSKEQARRAAILINEIMTNPSKKIDLFIAGTGAVGGTLIEQLNALDEADTNLSLSGTCNTQTVQWIKSSGEIANSESTNWPAIINALTGSTHSDTIFVDATGSEEVARLYPTLFEAGIHIVTPSKLANTFEQSYYDLLRKTATEHNAKFRYETTVGAGLPVLSTISELLNTGDTITEISGVVSGTMTYLFNQLENDVPFSKAIVDAREKGYAEPDPRDDLSGEDVARKFLTLAREIGLEIERDELQVESLIPDKLAWVDQDTFLKRLPDFDDIWTQKLKKAQQNGDTLRYVGQLKDGNITIGVQEVSQRSPLGNLQGTDNLFRISSQRYNQTPIIIQGPGAGKEVTAAGVLADVLKVTEGIKE